MFSFARLQNRLVTTAAKAWEVDSVNMFVPTMRVVWPTLKQRRMGIACQHNQENQTGFKVQFVITTVLAAIVDLRKEWFDGDTGVRVSFSHCPRVEKLFRHTLEHLGSCRVDFGRRHVLQTSCDPPFVTEGISHSGESFTPKHICRRHDNFRTITLHVRNHRVTIIHVEMNRYRRSTQRYGARRTTVLR